MAGKLGASAVRVWAELKRRKVVGTAIAYVIGAWVLVEVSATLFPALLLPEWTVRFVAVLAILGFPLVLTLSWFFDLRRDPSATVEQTDTANASTLESTRLPPPGESAEASIAVLPFDNLSADESHRFLADGFAAELHSSLSRAHRVRVVPKRSSFLHAGSNDSTADIGRKLGVQFVVTGSVRCDGERLRVIVGLDNASEEKQVWSRSYDGDRSDLLDFERAIAGQVVEAFGGVRLREEIRSASATTANVTAWGLVQRARSYLIDFSSSSLDAAVSALNEAIELDPDYSAAHAALASVLVERVANGFSADDEADRNQALEASERASHSAGGDVFTLKSCGMVWALLGQTNRSLDALRKATSLAPYDLGAWGYLGWPLSSSVAAASLDELDALMERLLNSSPEHPGAPYWLFHRSVGCSLAGNREAAVEYGRQSVEGNDRLPLAWMQLANALGACGNVDEARHAVDRATAISPDLSAARYRSIVQQMSSDDVVLDRRSGGIPA